VFPHLNAEMWGTRHCAATTNTRHAVVAVLVE